MTEEAVNHWIDGHPPYLDGFYSMMRYQLELARGSASGTSTFKPEQLGAELCLRCGHATGAPERSILYAAASIRLLSASFAIHDDLEVGHRSTFDLPTLWDKCGLPQALNTGDGLFSLAVNAMLEAAADPGTAVKLVRELMSVSLEHVSGQHLILSSSGSAGVPAIVRLRSLELTEGALAGYGAWAGGILGGADGRVLGSLRAYGRAVGAAAGLRDVMQSDIDAREFSAARRHHVEQALSALDMIDVSELGKASLRDLVAGV
jgi:geranylgeranyl diphosphate synthase type I